MLWYKKQPHQKHESLTAQMRQGAVQSQLGNRALEVFAVAESSFREMILKAMEPG